MPINNRHKALFLDRDGIINEDVGYASKPSHIRFVPGIFNLCRQFRKAGYLIIIVTNQSGIARNYYSEQDFRHLMDWMKHRFSIRGIQLTDVYHCPHHPDITGPCACRKPAPGMLLEAIRAYRIDPTASIMLGDKPSDMQAASEAGIGRRVLRQRQFNPEPWPATETIRDLHKLRVQP